jgi:FkbM family methyltransferase
MLDSSMPARASYAEHGEDRWVLEQLSGLDLDGGIYVEVGAYHPTRMSNTYLLYRKGLSGVLVEPNPEMVRLLRRFRPRDRIVSAGCDREAGTSSFFVYSTPADSSFSAERVPRNEIEKRLRRVATILVPVLPLDVILKAVEHEWVYFLSIDAEGMDDRVLRGAAQTLERTRLVCIESLPTNPGIDARIDALMLASGFCEIQRIAFNRFFQNQRRPDLGARRSA